MFAEDLVRAEEGQPQNFAYLLAAAVVLDSYFFKEELRAKKWTDEDTEAHNWLMQFADVGQPYWAELNHCKFDVGAGLQLGLGGIFIRDYKCYDMPSGFMGVSVSTGTIDTLISHFGQAEFGEACKAYTLKRGLGLYVIMAIQASEDGTIKKNILLFELNDNPVDQVIKTKGQNMLALIEGTEDMQLSNKTVLTQAELGVDATATYFEIGNNRYSRKAFEAVVKGNLEWQ